MASNVAQNVYISLVSAFVLSTVPSFIPLPPLLPGSALIVCMSCRVVRQRQRPALNSCGRSTRRPRRWSPLRLVHRRSTCRQRSWRDGWLPSGLALTGTRLGPTTAPSPDTWGACPGTLWIGFRLHEARRLCISDSRGVYVPLWGMFRPTDALTGMVRIADVSFTGAWDALALAPAHRVLVLASSRLPGLRNQPRNSLGCCAEIRVLLGQCPWLKCSNAHDTPDILSRWWEV